MFCSIASAEPPSIYINGDKLVTESSPVIENGRTLVPLRAIFEALNKPVYYISSDRSIVSGNINLQIDNTKAKVGVQQVTLDVSPKIIDDRTYIPLRFIAESIGAKVNWNGEKHSVEIIYLATMSIQKKYSMITNGLSLSKTDLQELSCIENYILTNEAIEIWNALDDEAKNTFKSNIITEMRIKIPNLLTYELNFFDSDNTEIDQYKWEDANIKAEIEKKAKEDSLNYPSIKRK